VVYELVRWLREEGIPVHFGVQTHTGVDKPFNKEDLKAIFREYGAIADIVLNEMSVALTVGSPEELQQQARRYADYVSAGLEINEEFRRPVVRAMLPWGISDRESDKMRAIFDKDLNPKPAYFAILNALCAAASQP